MTIYLYFGIKYLYNIMYNFYAKIWRIFIFKLIIKCWSPCNDTPKIDQIQK